MSITAFAIAAGQNTGDKHDATGAFIPGASKFGKAFNCPWRSFDNTGTNTVVRKRFLDTIETQCPGGTNYFAYFGHGYTKGLGSAHLSNDQLDDLVKVLTPKISKPLVVALFACSCGVAQGFSGKLREKLGSEVWVYGHTSVGHSFLNPDVSEEASCNSPSYRLFYPYGTELRGPWAEAIKYTDLWLRFPLLEDATLNAEVNSRRLLGTWEITGSGATQHYEFDTSYNVWTMDSGRAIDEPPAGTVKAFDPKKPKTAVDQGTWPL